MQCSSWYRVVLVLGVCNTCVWQHAVAASGLPCLPLRRDARIVGGVDTERDETPFIVSLTRRGGHICGGIVLNHRWLLTAGHCICNGLGRIMKPGQIKAMLGAHKITDDNNAIDSHGYEVDIANIVPHPSYSCSSPDNDIALLEVALAIVFDDRVRPACISMNANDDGADHQSIADGVTATVSGWGWTNEDQQIGERADVLQKAVVMVWNSEKCQRMYDENSAGGLVLTQRQICAGFEAGGIDSCWADSGGPLVSNGNVLIGIVSTGVGCARPGLPGIYTKVSEFVDWIETVAGA